jgi:hypothetical protein
MQTLAQIKQSMKESYFAPITSINNMGCRPLPIRCKKSSASNPQRIHPGPSSPKCFFPILSPTGTAPRFLQIIALRPSAMACNHGVN